MKKNTVKKEPWKVKNVSWIPNDFQIYMLVITFVIRIPPPKKTISQVFMEGE